MEANTRDLTSEIERLDRLRTSGEISSEEFNALKADVLSRDGIPLLKPTIGDQGSTPPGLGKLQLVGYPSVFIRFIDRLTYFAGRLIARSAKMSRVHKASSGLTGRTNGGRCESRVNLRPKQSL